MWKTQHTRKLSRRRAIAALQAIMILAVCLIILLGMQFLWNPKYGGAEGLFTSMNEKINTVLNGGEEPDSSGDGSGDGGPTGQDGDSDDSDDSGSDNGTGDNSGPGNDDDDSGTGGNNSDDDSNPDPNDDGHVDPLWDDFPEVLANALANQIVERREEAMAQFMEDSVARLAKADAARDAAAMRLQQAILDPELSPLTRLDLENQAAAARIEAHNAKLATEHATQTTEFAKGMNKRFTNTVALLGATETLFDTDRKRQELIKQGKFEEAWRVSLGGALRTVSEVATGFTDKLPGIGGSIASEAINTAAEMAGRNLADNSFPAMVNLSHWLYGHSWWPKDIRPRFPPGYRPPQQN